MSRSFSLALCSVSILTLSLFSGCSSDEASETNPLTPGNGGGTQAAGGGSNAGSGGASMGGRGMGGNMSNGEAGTTGNIAGQAGTGMAGGIGGSGNGNEDGADSGAPPAEGEGTEDDGTMSFFVTSRGMGTGGNLGGLQGADDFCRELAVAANAANASKTWHAYLSTTTVDARDRIGSGPWRNQAGVIVANNVTQLHDQVPPNTTTLMQTWPLGNATIALDEQGTQVPNNLHDILTGTQLDGTLAQGANCSDWTSTQGTAQNGHSNRAGLGEAESWTSAHTVGCGEPTNGMNFQQGTVSQGGGRGSFYCFAVITGP